MDTRLWRVGMAVGSLVLLFAAIVTSSAGALAVGSLLLILALAAAVVAVGRGPGWRGGLALGAAWVVCWGLTVYFAPVVIEPPRNSGTRCLSDVKQQVIGMLMYASDHDERLPLAPAWHTSLKPYVKAEFHCPLGKTRWSYAMNRSLSGAIDQFMTDEEPDDKVLLFEADATQPNASGGREWLVFRHDKRAALGFTDGHAKLYNAAEAAALWWK